MRRYRRCRRHQAGDAVKRLPAAIFQTATMAGCGGGGKALAAPDSSPHHRNLVEFVAAVVMAQSGDAGACTAASAAAAATATFPSRGVRAATTASSAPTTAAPKRLHQPLGARRHSTQMIQPSGLFSFLSAPKPPFGNDILLRLSTRSPHTRDRRCHRSERNVTFIFSVHDDSDEITKRISLEKVFNATSRDQHLGICTEPTDGHGTLAVMDTRMNGTNPEERKIHGTRDFRFFLFSDVDWSCCSDEAYRL